MHTIHFSLPDGPATIVYGPGVRAPGPANLTLFQAARRMKEERAFVTGPGCTASALWAARAGAEVTVWLDSAAESAALAATFAKSPGVPAPHLTSQPDFSSLEAQGYDLTLLHLPRGRELQVERLQLAAALLRPGGRLVFSGAKQEGVKSALKQAQEIFGQAGIVARKSGYHAGLAQRPEGEFPIPELTCAPHEVQLAGVPTHLVGCTGVFAGDRVDGGTAALVAGMQIRPQSHVLDLGCGTGLAGLAALRQGAEVVLTDVSLRAVASARRTLAANGYPAGEGGADARTRVYHCHGAAPLGVASVDTVITNPPFHTGHEVDYEISEFFVAEAARVLRAGGETYLVANAFLNYAPWLKAHFSRVSLAWENKQYRVWRGRK